MVDRSELSGGTLALEHQFLEDIQLHASDVRRTKIEAYLHTVETVYIPILYDCVSISH